MTFVKFKEWMLLGLIAGAVGILWEMNKNIYSLNEKMAVIIVERQQDRININDHELRIRKLENK